MPTYEYACPTGHHFEKIQKITDKARARCPTCGAPATRRISGGAGLVFKGSGFYITDYGKDGKGPRKDPVEGGAKAGSDKADKTPKADAKPEAKADAKPAAKTESAAPKKAAE